MSTKRYGLLDRLDTLIFRWLLPTKTYPDWEAAEKEAGPNAYTNSILNEFRIARGREADPSAMDHVLASVIRDGYRITDFGGSTGHLGQLLIARNSSISYTVVENPTMVELMQSQDSPVKFSTAIPKECDIFYSSSTIQYVSDPYGALTEGFGSARHYAILVRNHFADVERFTVQRSRLFDNGSGPLPSGFKNLVLRYPRRTIQEKKVLGLAQDCGFALDQAHEDRRNEYKGGYSRDLVFKRIS